MNDLDLQIQVDKKENKEKNFQIDITCSIGVSMNTISYIKLDKMTSKKDI